MKGTDEELARAVLCAAALVCNGDRDTMSTALLGALVENACGDKQPAAVLDDLIAGLEVARRRVSAPATRSAVQA